MTRSATEYAHRLIDAVAAPLAAPRRRLPVPIADDPGLAELTGYRDGPPLTVPPGPVALAAAATAVLEAYTGISSPGASLLVERATLLGLHRNAPWSPGGAFRAVPGTDGWLGFSLARAADLELVPALVEGPVNADPWCTVANWSARRPVAAAFERAQLLGLPAAPIPAPAPIVTRPPVVVTPGGPRRVVDRPLVVDLTALWAGPLCARLLGLGGARIVKVESSSRPDGARLGSAEFYRRLHDGHESRTIDFTHRRADLLALVARADVVLEASRPRALRQLGVEAARHVARGAVWVSITAYGRGDELRVGFGDDIAAGAGLFVWTPLGPVPVGDALADPLTGLYAAAATAVALTSRRGALLDISMHDVAREASLPGNADRE